MTTNCLNDHLGMVKTDRVNVLIVDDSLLVYKLIEKYLKQENFELFYAKNAAEALNSIGSIMPDIILLDILLPEVDGYNLLKLLRLSKRTENIPIVMISSLDRGMDISRALNYGAENYIIKPFNSTELKTKIKQALHNHESLVVS